MFMSEQIRKRFQINNLGVKFQRKGRVSGFGVYTMVNLKAVAAKHSKV